MFICNWLTEQQAIFLRSTVLALSNLQGSQDPQLMEVSFCGIIYVLSAMIHYPNVLLKRAII